MARKILKGILFILLAVVVAGAIVTYMRTQRKAPPVAPKPILTPTPSTTFSGSSEVRDLTVSPQGSNARVVIEGITSREYQIQNLESDDGFKIRIPKTKIMNVQRELEEPHPLINKIEVRELEEDPDTAEIIFRTAGDGKLFG